MPSESKTDLIIVMKMNEGKPNIFCITFLNNKKIYIKL